VIAGVGRPVAAAIDRYIEHGALQPPPPPQQQNRTGVELIPPHLLHLLSDVIVVAGGSVLF
jgi:hypothetical protein